MPPEPNKFKVLPEHTRELLEMLAVGAGDTVALDMAVAEQPAALFPIKVYWPLAARGTLVIVGFCRLDVNEFGPLQVYVLAPEALKVKLLPTHAIGLLTVTVGKELMTTVVCATAVQPAMLVTYTV